MTSQADRAWKDMATPPLPHTPKDRSPARKPGRAAYSVLFQPEPLPRSSTPDGTPWLLLRDSTLRRTTDR